MKMTEEIKKNLAFEKAMAEFKENDRRKVVFEASLNSYYTCLKHYSDFLKMYSIDHVKKLGFEVSKKTILQKQLADKFIKIIENYQDINDCKGSKLQQIKKMLYSESKLKKLNPILNTYVELRERNKKIYVENIIIPNKETLKNIDMLVKKSSQEKEKMLTKNAQKNLNIILAK